MPSWMKLAAGWLAAAIVAVAFSWGAVSQVRNRVIQPSIEIPTTAAVVAAAGSTTTTLPTVIRVEPEVLTPTTAATTDPTPGPSENDDTTTTTTAAPSATTTTTVPASVTTTPPPPAPTSTTTTTTTTTTEPPETETSSYSLAGGTVTISYSPGVVNFVSAIPQAGFSTDLRETGPDRVRVRFEGESHTSDFRAEWEGGELKITQNETGED